ncbi:MAG TPA: zinc-ribbon and DUF3426 domain-containing protein [Xanthomonadales bacterium]|nr:zinc-ribbon and DUF3426 domain-containing protein [Xanthomonadales bacterium]
MYTRCQGCHTVHPVNAALLSRAKGQFRCGRCNKLANALDALFDEWPSAGDLPAATGEPPVLGGVVALEQEESETAAMAEAADPADPADLSLSARRQSPWLRVSWIAAGLVVVLGSAWWAASYFGVIDRDKLEQSLVSLGVKDAPPEKPFRNTSSIELVSREMLSHPSRPRVLLLNATIVNRAPQAQPYPEIQVKLFDLDNEIISERRFRPTDYLTSTSSMRGGMTPDAYLRFTLEMLDPGDRAVGFELEFF